MANKLSRQSILPYLIAQQAAVSLKELQSLLPQQIAERTLRRWLAFDVENGRIIKEGEKRATRYRAVIKQPTPDFKFLADKPLEKQQQILKQLRD